MALKGKEIIISAEPIKVLHMLCLEYHSVHPQYHIHVSIMKMSYTMVDISTIHTQVSATWAMFNQYPEKSTHVCRKKKAELPRMMPTKSAKASR
jgi:hypothetical protein